MYASIIAKFLACLWKWCVVEYDYKVIVISTMNWQINKSTAALPLYQTEWKKRNNDGGDGSSNEQSEKRYRKQGGFVDFSKNDDIHKLTILNAEAQHTQYWSAYTHALVSRQWRTACEKTEEYSTIALYALHTQHSFNIIIYVRKQY